MDLPKRKRIRLENYDYSQNNVFFITICTFNRAHLFGEIVGATLCGRPNNPDKMVGNRLLALENKFENVKIDNYVVMPDHLHILLRLTRDSMGTPLPKIIDWFKTMTTNDYIKSVKNGLYTAFEKHIWQRNYYDHIIRSQDDYNEIWQYIEDNPINWGLKQDNINDYIRD